MDDSVPERIEPTSLKSVPKLSEANHRNWFLRVTFLLKALLLWSVVEKGAPAPPIELAAMPTLMLPVGITEDEQKALKAAYAEQLAAWKALEQQYLADQRAYDKAFKQYVVDDAKALSILVQCVSDAHMHIFEKPGITAKGAWQALKDLMEPSSMMRCFLLFQSLFRDLKFVDGKDNLGDFINRAQSIFTQMSPLFPNMDRSLLVWAVLCALPQRLHPTRDVILSHKASTMTAEQAFQLLLGADQVQRSQGQRGDPDSDSHRMAVAMALSLIHI